MGARLLDFRRRIARPGGCTLLGGAICQRDVAHETRTISCDKIKYESRGLTFGCINDECLFEPHRCFCIEHNAGATLHDQPVAESFHQPTRLLAGVRGELESCPRQVDHHAIRIGKHKSGDVYLPAQIDHEACLLVVPSDSDVGGDGLRPS